MLGPLGRYDHPWKKKQINTHPGPQPPIALPGWRAKKRRSAPPVRTAKSNAASFTFFLPWSFFLQKIKNSTFLHIRAWNLYSEVLWYAESDRVIFIKILRLLEGVPPFLENKTHLLRLVTCDGWKRILMNPTYLKSASKILFFWCVHWYENSTF